MRASDAHPLRRFYAKRSSVARVVVVAAIACFLFGLMVARAGLDGMHLMLVGWLIWVASRNVKVPLVEVFAENVVIRSSPISPARRVAFVDVVDVRRPWTCIASLVARLAGEQKSVELPIDSLETHEQDELIALLRRSMASSAVLSEATDGAALGNA